MCNIGVTFEYGVGVKTGCQNTQNLDIWRWEEVFASQNNVSDYIVLYKLCVKHKGTYVYGMCLHLWPGGGFKDIRTIYKNIHKYIVIKEFPKISILFRISLCKTVYLFVAFSLSLFSYPTRLKTFLTHYLCVVSWCSVWLIELLVRCQIPTRTYCPTYLQYNDFQFTLFGLNRIQHRDYSSDIFTKHCLYPQFGNLVLIYNFLYVNSEMTII